jgi:hypothetical protein
VETGPEVCTEAVAAVVPPAEGGDVVLREGLCMSVC